MKYNIDIEKLSLDIYLHLLNKSYDKQKYLRFYIWKRIFKFHFGDKIPSEYYLRKIFYNMVLNGFFEVELNFKKHTYKLFNPNPAPEKKIGLVCFD